MEKEKDLKPSNELILLAQKMIFYPNVIKLVDIKDELLKTIEKIKKKRLKDFTDLMVECKLIN